MILRSSLRLAASVAILALSVASSASAGPIWTINSDAKGGVGQLETVTWTFNGASTTGLAGTITTAQVPGGQSFDTYCIDLYHDFQVGNGGTSWQAEVLPISAFTGDVGVTAPNNAGGNAGAIGYLYSTYAAGVSTAIQGAALQVAIWKVDYDNSNSFSTGSYQFAADGDSNSVQSQVFAQATAYLAGFDGTQSSGNASYFRATSHPNATNQDLVGPAFLQPNAVPEPASMAMTLAGLASIGLVARFRRRRGA